MLYFDMVMIQSVVNIQVAYILGPMGENVVDFTL